VIELTIGSAAIDSTLASMPTAAREAIYAEWRADYAALDSAAFPHSVDIANALYPGTADDRFVFALDRLLDGLQTELSA
jgi:hypothetical protein